MKNGEERHLISLAVNGETASGEVRARTLLSDFLRHQAGCYGVHVGCEHGVCGACTILLDGKAVRSCLLFAVQAANANVMTIEGLAPEGGLHPIQEAFWDEHALQCGFCTPGFILSIYEYLQNHEAPTDDEIREALSGNLCRCTGYVNIVKAVKRVAAELAGESA